MRATRRRRRPARRRPRHDRLTCCSRADGVGSTNPHRLFWPSRPRLVRQQRLARGATPLDDVDRSAATQLGLWLGPGAHLVHYPVRGGADLNIVAICAGSSGALAAAPMQAFCPMAAARREPCPHWNALAADSTSMRRRSWVEAASRSSATLPTQWRRAPRRVAHRPSRTPGCWPKRSPANLMIHPLHWPVSNARAARVSSALQPRPAATFSSIIYVVFPLWRVMLFF